MTARRWASGFVLAALGGMLGASGPGSAAGQSPSVTPAVTDSSPPEPLARVVHLDAVVTDRDGRPILNLGRQDFEVVENGVAQKLDAVELRRAAPPGSGSVVPILTAGDERTAARAAGTRVMALLLDEFHVAPGPPTERVREAFLRFLDEELRPTDLLAVLKPLDSIAAIRFTRDHAAAREAVRGFNGRKGDYEARTEFEEKYIGRAPQAVRAARSQIVLSGLRALISRLGELGAGRSAVVFVTEGIASAGRRRSARRVPDAQGLVRAASRANVAIYAFDPGGDGQEPAGGDGDREPGAGDAARGSLLDVVAAQTGGEAVADPAEFEAALRRVSRDLDGYYVLSYTSSHTGDGRFYDVQVRARRAGARVRARTGYWAPVRTEALRPSDRRTTPPRVIRKSPLIETWLGLTVTREGAHHVTFTWTAADLRGRRGAALPAPSTVGLRATTPEGAVLFEGEIGAARVRGAAMRDDAAFFEAAPGRIQLDVTIFAADGSQIDQAAQDVEVPDTTRADPLILPPQVFSASSAREFREIRSDPAAAPEPAREFRRTERLLLRVPTHSASGAATSLTARVLNRSGQALRDIPALREALDGIRQFDLPLSWLAPGEYTIELNATNATGAAREIIRIRVTG